MMALAAWGWWGKDERDTAHPILRITIPQQDGRWRNEMTR